MADLSDVTAYLADTAAAAVYPNGTSQTSVAGIDVRIFEGWPLPEKLDRDVQGLNDDGTARTNGVAAQVSVYPMSGTGVTVYQILDETYTIKQPAITTQVSVVDQFITVIGDLSPGEYLTIVIDDKTVCSAGADPSGTAIDSTVWSPAPGGIVGIQNVSGDLPSVVFAAGATVTNMLAALAVQAQNFGIAATSTANTLTVPFGHSLVVRQGGAAVMGRVTHRQKHPVMVTVWAPNPDVRRVLASAIDNKIKTANKVSMPDTSQAIVVYNRTLVTDEHQTSSIYRRDLIFDVEYATVEEFPGYVITSTNVTIAKPDNTAVAYAIS